MAVISFTGAFGSGCTTAAKHLQNERGYIYVSLSQVIRDEWERQGGTGEPERKDLQSLGDQLREEKHRGILPELALKEVKKDERNIAVDSIRNPGEVEWLRRTYGDQFTLIALVASPDQRWSRIGTTQYLDKGRKRADFDADDARDRNEETPVGQQVEICVDEADLLIDNGEVLLDDFKEKVERYASLSVGESKRFAEPTEIFMHMAYSASHSSKCLKRHVGAVLVNDRGDVVGVGYNENPTGTLPCVEEPAYEKRCFRDIVRNDGFLQLADKGAMCPVCKEQLAVIDGPPWRCPNCQAQGVKTNLEAFFFPDRAISWCTAIHAEDRALVSAAGAARGSTLYVTTFPCFQCAEKLTHAGVKQMIFTEAYPDPHSAKRLRLATVPYRQFEGVRSAAFERIFSTMRPR